MPLKPNLCDMKILDDFRNVNDIYEDGQINSLKTLSPKIIAQKILAQKNTFLTSDYINLQINLYDDSGVYGLYPYDITRYQLFVSDKQDIALDWLHVICHQEFEQNKDKYYEARLFVEEVGRNKCIHKCSVGYSQFYSNVHILSLKVLQQGSFYLYVLINEEPLNNSPFKITTINNIEPAKQQFQTEIREIQRTSQLLSPRKQSVLVQNIRRQSRQSIFLPGGGLTSFGRRESVMEQKIMSTNKIKILNQSQFRQSIYTKYGSPEQKSPRKDSAGSKYRNSQNKMISSSQTSRTSRAEMQSSKSPTTKYSQQKNSVFKNNQQMQAKQSISGGQPQLRKNFFKNYQKASLKKVDEENLKMQNTFGTSAVIKKSSSNISNFDFGTGMLQKQENSSSKYYEQDNQNSNPGSRKEILNNSNDNYFTNKIIKKLESRSNNQFIQQDDYQINSEYPNSEIFSEFMNSNQNIKVNLNNQTNFNSNQQNQQHKSIALVKCKEDYYIPQNQKSEKQLKQVSSKRSLQPIVAEDEENEISNIKTPKSEDQQKNDEQKDIITSQDEKTNDSVNEQDYPLQSKQHIKQFFPSNIPQQLSKNQNYMIQSPNKTEPINIQPPMTNSSNYRFSTHKRGTILSSELLVNRLFNFDTADEVFKQNVLRRQKQFDKHANCKKQYGRVNELSSIENSIEEPHETTTTENNNTCMFCKDCMKEQRKKMHLFSSRPQTSLTHRRMQPSTAPTSPNNKYKRIWSASNPSSPLQSKIQSPQQTKSNFKNLNDSLESQKSPAQGSDQVKENQKKHKDFFYSKLRRDFKVNSSALQKQLKKEQSESRYTPLKYYNATCQPSQSYTHYFERMITTTSTGIQYYKKNKDLNSSSAISCAKLLNKMNNIDGW